MRVTIQAHAFTLSPVTYPKSVCNFSGQKMILMMRIQQQPRNRRATAKELREIYSQSVGEPDKELIRNGKETQTIYP